MKKGNNSVEIKLLFECAYCNREASSEADKSTFKLCSGCYKVHYCNKECQLAHRKSHKVACKATKTNSLNCTKSIIRVNDYVGDLLSYCSNGDLEGLRSLISRGGGLRALLSDKQLAFEVLTELFHSHFYECAELLLQHKVDPNAQSEEGYSPLFIACQNGHDKCISLLLQHNADPNIVDKNLVSPLFIACQNGHEKCVLLLLQHNADPNSVSNDLTSPLYMACQNGNDKCVSLLLQHNADPNIANNNGASPLYVACQNDHDKCVSLLLHAGGNTEQMHSSGRTPPLFACFRGHLKCVALLVEHGANIHYRSVPLLQSALHLSCMSRNVNVVAYILSLGVDVNITDANGLTPLQYCYMFGMENIAKLLIEHGADESTMNLPDDVVLKNQMMIEKLLAESKELRQQAKHCDYPDCSNEGDDSQSLHACSSCRAVYYCSREHQEAHWKEHKKLCKAIKK